MKVITPKEISRVEAIAFEEGFLEADFMENAGEGVADVVHSYVENHHLKKQILLLCGKGNNAGDAFVAGVSLLSKGYQVHALHLEKISQCSPLCQHQYARFMSAHGIIIEDVRLDRDFFIPYSLIIDGIFGTGFRGKVEEPYASMILLANESNKPIIAIDIPSGLNGENGVVEGNAITAVKTVYLGLPKKGFFFHEGWNHIGSLSFVDFGLPQQLVEKMDSSYNLLTRESVKPFLPKIVRNRNKYEAGYVVGVAGSSGMSGAAMLSSYAVLRGGAGMMRLMHPDGMQPELVNSPYEVIKTPYFKDRLDEVIKKLSHASAVFFGPGMGRSDDVFKTLKTLLPAVQKPCVIDADALYFLSKEEATLPVQTILTPHLGEMLKLLKMKNLDILDENFLQTCQKYAESKKVTLVLKGGPTWVFHQGKKIAINPFGDPGMATGGSGDILTGLLTALLAQGVPSYEAACLGVVLHGIAGQEAAIDKTSYSMVASDMIEKLPQAIQWISRD